MFDENLYDNYIEALTRILGTSQQEKINRLYEEIFSSKKPNTNKF